VQEESGITLNTVDSIEFYEQVEKTQFESSVVLATRFVGNQEVDSDYPEFR
jgi:hypothetical protein